MSPSYSGEPSLLSSTSKGVQIDYANKGFVDGLTAVSMQVAIDPGQSSSALFGLGTSSDHFVEVVGVVNGKTVAGPDPSHLTTIGKIPTNTAYPAGWVYFTTDSFSNSSGTYMQAFVDQTEAVNATVAVPNLANYTGALIETANQAAYYTNIVVTSYEIPITIPGYNNMEGYGQGSALLVKLLPEYYNLTAEMTLKSWSVPQNNILSFQINAMNSTGTLKSTCRGFFQLGLDVNVNGDVAPWFVPGINCESNYFFSGRGISTPPGSELILSIVWSGADQDIVFTIRDKTTSQTFSSEIPYSGGGFYASYTQMEFQPCCNKYPITDYKFRGSLFNMQITEMSGKSEYLSANYMLPFTLDAPTSWNFNYYVGSNAGYNEESL